MAWIGWEEAASRSETVEVVHQSYREGLAELLGRFAWQYFITLTWDPSRRRHQLDAHRAEKIARVAMSKLARLVGGRHWQRQARPVIQYAGVLERSQEGVFHVHLVAILSRPITSAESRAFWTWWNERFGFSNLKPVSDLAGLVKYMTKAAGPRETFFVSDDLQ